MEVAVYLVLVATHFKLKSTSLILSQVLDITGADKRT